MTVATQWWWVRHGPTHSHCLNGWTDVPADLSDVASIERLSAFLPHDALVISSDLLRARSTADAIVGNRVRLPDAGSLRELDFGDWEGKSVEEVSRTHPDESRRFWENPTSNGPPGGEHWTDFESRVSAFVDQCASDHEGRNIVAVAHFGTILTQVNRASNLGGSSPFSRRVDNLSVTRLTARSGAWKLHEFSYCP